MYIGNRAVISKLKYNHPKILLLFGAGASNGSGGVNIIPPLGNELFKELCNQFPDSWNYKIKGNLREKFEKEGFEIGMQSLYKNPEDLAADVANLLREMTIYFSKFTIVNRQNLYLKLVNQFSNEFKNREIIIATLNYECLIEYALISNRLNIDWDGNGVG